MEATSLTLQLSGQQYERLLQFARNRNLKITEIAEVAISEWLERQARLTRARALMRELGNGLEEGTENGTVARDHDKFLYPAKNA